MPDPILTGTSVFDRQEELAQQAQSNQVTLLAFLGGSTFAGILTTVLTNVLITSKVKLDDKQMKDMVASIVAGVKAAVPGKTTVFR